MKISHTDTEKINHEGHIDLVNQEYIFFSLVILSFGLFNGGRMKREAYGNT